MRLFFALLVSGVLLFSVSSRAAEPPKALMGTWSEKGDGGLILWKLSPQKIDLAPLDSSGKVLAEPTELDVVYEPLRNGWVLVVQAPDGTPVGEGSLMPEGDKLILFLPGIGTHELHRAAGK